jgi:Predicted periplasmic ligand-binding sensor domain
MQKLMNACNLRILNLPQWLARLLLCVLMLSLLPFLSAAEKYQFTHFNTSNSNLSYDTVQEICQSRDGFIWVGTSSGLSRYDGRHFRSYDRKDFGMRSDFVVALGVDFSDNLFVGTDEGLCIYDRHLDRFNHFVQKSDIGTVIEHKVNCIRSGLGTTMWMSVNSQGLFSLDTESGQLKNYFVKDGRQTLSVNIRSFCLDSKETVYIALYYNGLYRADLSSNTLSPVLHGEDADLFAGDDINSMLVKPGDDNIIYLASVSKGLCEVNIARDEVSVLIPSSRGFYAEELFIDKDGNIWMGTSDGVYIYNTVTGTTEHLVENQNDKFGMSDKHVFAVFVDRHGCVWLGTNVGGINYSGVFQRNFEKYYTLDDKPIGDCLVRGFTRDGNGHLWICTEKSGLLKYDISSRKLERCSNPGLPKELVSIQYHAGRLWIGSMKGLCRLDLSTGNVRMYKTLEHTSGMKDSKVYTLFEIRDGGLLVGTTLGLLRYDDATDRFIPLKAFEGQFITDVVQDSDGTLWASTYAGGLFHYDPSSDNMLKNYCHDPADPLSIPSNKLFSVEIDSRSRIWAASFSGGFFMLEPESGQITTYNTGNHPNLPGNIYFEIKEDLDGMIWVSSDKGLISLDPETHLRHTF